jgi:PAS domain S-box-containing protein
MIDINLLDIPSFILIEETSKIDFNLPFDKYSDDLKDQIKNCILNKKLSVIYQEKNYHLTEISPLTYIVIEEPIENYQSIRESTRLSMALQMRILNELGEGIFIEDKTGKIIFVNPSAEKILNQFGYEIVGKSFLNFIFPDEEKIRIERILSKMFSEPTINKSSRFETQIKSKNSEIIYLLVYYSIMLTNQLVEGALITIYDISDMKKLTKEIQERSNELIQAEKLTSIGLLASGISHELNNPLSFIISNTTTIEDYIKSLLDYLNEMEDLLQRTINTTKFQKDYEQIILNAQKNEIKLIKKDIFDILKANRRGLTKLSDVISDLRKFSHSNRNDYDQREETNVLDTIKLALNLLSYELKTFDVQLQIEDEKRKYLILANSKLYQVFLNLIYNASQAINENSENKNGKIIINIFEMNKKIVIQISDNGIGILEKNLPRIFDPFYTTKPPGVGTGLGLSLSQRIINDLGGYIVAESGTIMTGATFTIYFPVYEH